VLDTDDIELRVKSQGGFAVGREGGEVVALDLTLNDELLRRGYLRDLVRQVQDLRKTTGLDVSDRITLHLVGVDDLSDGFALVASEVLATEIHATAGIGDGEELSFDDERTDARAWVAKTQS
jgi:isoleucyl-tRNA synthetase